MHFYFIGSYEYWSDQIIEFISIIYGSWILSGIVALLLIAFVFVYLGMPIYLYLTLRQVLEPSLTLLERESESAEVVGAREYFRGYDLDLEENGFKQQLEFVMTDSSNRTKTLGQIWWHQGGKIQLCLFVMYFENGDEYICTSKGYEFSSLFMNGVMLETSNDKNYARFYRNPKKISATLFWELNILNVFKAHQAFIAEYEKHSPIVARYSRKNEQDVMKRLAADCRKEIRHNIDNGSYIPINQKECRLSFVATFSVVYQLIPPIKQLKEWIIKRKVMNKLNELGVVLD